jgi:hypothetical protein
MTAQLDHVVVDRYGVLIIESKVRRGATIKGSDVQKQWTACYPGRRNASFQNPLAQNREHENAVRQALRNAGSPLDPDFVKSAVVFAEADLTQLELDSLARLRVVDISGVGGLIESRHDFAVNSGGLSDADVAALAGLFRGLDRSGDASVAEQHASYRGDKRSAAPNATRGTQSRNSSVADRLQRALAEMALRVLLVVVVVGAFWWLFVGPGQGWLFDYLTPGVSNDGQTASPSGTPAGPTVADAKAALLEIDPEKYAALASPDSPIVTSVPQGTTFTWEYVQASGSVAQVKTIALTLDASGQVVGASIE